MPRQPTFPITIMAGSTAIRIYFNPLKAERSQAGNSTSAASDAKSYDSYVVTYYQGGKRIRTRHNSLQSARDKADSIRTAILNEDTTALTLKGEDIIIYARAKNLIAPFDVSLDEVAKEYVAAREILEKISLMEAARFYDRFGKTVKENKSIPTIVKELNANLEADGKSEYHRRDMKRRLQAFALAFPKPIMEVKTSEISDWIRTLKGRDKKGNAVELAPKSRNHYRNSVVQLFNMARDNGYLPKGMPSLTQNQINPKKLLLSKWTAVNPQEKERHFLVTKVIDPEQRKHLIEFVVIEAVLTKRSFTMRWEELTDATKWAQGWI